MVGLAVALAHDIEDKRWYWLFVAGGVWLWLVSLLPGYCGCCVYALVLFSTALDKNIYKILYKLYQSVYETSHLICHPHPHPAAPSEHA